MSFLFCHLLILSLELQRRYHTLITEMTWPFHLPPLSYPYDALEPFIDRETMRLHHDKHFQTYIDNLNAALKNTPEYHSWTLTKLLTDLEQIPEPLRTSVRNNGGGTYSHDLYFDLLAPPGQEIATDILDYYDSSRQFFADMKAAGLGQFGSGYAWLVIAPDGSLQIMALPNQDNPLTLGFYPLLAMDVWEHAYYLKYHNLRGSYIDNWFHVINWEAVFNRLFSFHF